MMKPPEFYMQRCIELALQAAGRTSPNPLVGAVVVDDDGEIIAEGLHEQYGQAHAEVNALDGAGDRARGKTIYVNLEPCCHHGKTPPCSDKVIASGIKQVVFGMLDPNPKVAGGGHKALEQAGIATKYGVLENECRYLNRGFLKWLKHQQPWVCLKMAGTLDGKIADRTGTSKWITGSEARHHVQELRNAYDCVLIGGETALQDDPELTVRDLPNGRNPIRAIISSNVSVKNDSRLAQNADRKTWLFTTEDSVNRESARFGENVRLIASPSIDKKIDLRWVLHFLGTQGVRYVLCEGGATLAGSFVAERLVDEVEWFIAPKLLGDKYARSAVEGTAERKLSSAVTFISHTYKQIGEDLLFRGLINAP